MSVPFVIIRGAAGAGKSTFANRLRGTENAFIFETDNFFIDSVNGRDYHFDPKLLGIAHTWNQGEVIRACRDCPDVPVIVANTFRTNEELKPYFDIATMFKRKIFVFTLYTEHDNRHGVPDKTVDRMRKTLVPFCWKNFSHIENGYSIDIKTDEDAAAVAQTMHFKYFQKK